MYKEIRQAYMSLSAEQKVEMQSWASERFQMSPTSVKVNWMYGGSIPKEYQEEVINKLKSFK